MPQKLVQEYAEKMVSNEKKFFNELSVLRKIYISGPDYVSYLDAAGSDAPPKKVYPVCQRLMEQGILDRTLVKSDEWNGSVAAYKISDDIYNIVSNYVAENLKGKNSK